MYADVASWSMDANFVATELTAECDVVHGGLHW